MVHLASIRPGESAARDHTLARLCARLHADTARRTLVLGDLNTATTDRALDHLTPLREAQTAAGSGFGFTWPARFPVTRPDHILFTGMRPVSAQAVRTAGSATAPPSRPSTSDPADPGRGRRTYVVWRSRRRRAGTLDER